MEQIPANAVVGDAIKLLSSVGARVVGQVQIDQCRFQVGVAKEFLNPTQRRASFKEVRGHAVPEGMRRNGFSNSYCFGGKFDTVLNTSGIHRGHRPRG